QITSTHFDPGDLGRFAEPANGFSDTNLIDTSRGFDDLNVRDFVAADVNGDGRMDLVKVQTLLTAGAPAQGSPFKTRVWSLIAAGKGTWEGHVREVDQPYQASKNWRPMEVNGDGRTDLAYPASKPGEQLKVSSMLSMGNGSWASVTTAGPFEAFDIN